ncbi:MAG: oligosaccharide flippase family protein [Rhodospirillaceae bacterium]|nr:oligosaccharide flippase family protein [Rhodospirillaceae bacterium]MBT6118264.1 oligosaccharide flippase family protein [Rhodospirillaceae bacterium]
MKDLLYTGFAHVIVALASLGSGVLAARILGPEGRGELAAVFLYPQIAAALTTVVLVDAVVYWSARKSAPPGQIFASACALILLIGIPVAAAGILLAPTLYAGHRPEVVFAASLYFGHVLLGALGLTAAGMFQGALRMGVWNGCRIAVTVLYPGFVLGFLVMGRVTLTEFVIAQLLANAALLIGVGAMIRREGWTGWRPDFALMRRFAIYVLPILSGVALATLNGRLDQIFIERALTAEDLGLYVVAFGVAGLVSNFTSLLSVLTFPKVAARAEPEQKAVILGRFLRLAVAVALGGTVALYLLADWLLALLYGDAFVAATPLLHVLVLATLPLAAKAILIQGCKAYERLGPIGRTEGIALAVNATALLVLMPRLGVVGAAWAAVLSQSCAVIYLLIVARGTFGIGIGELLRPRLDDLRHAWNGLRDLRASGRAG